MSDRLRAAAESMSRRLGKWEGLAIPARAAAGDDEAVGPIPQEIALWIEARLGRAWPGEFRRELFQRLDALATAEEQAKHKNYSGYQAAIQRTNQSPSSATAFASLAVACLDALDMQLMPELQHLCSSVCWHIWVDQATVAYNQLVERYILESADRGVAVLVAICVATAVLHEVAGLCLPIAVVFAASAVLVPVAGATLVDPTRVFPRDMLACEYSGSTMWASEPT